MSKFLTGNLLEEKLTDIIWNAKKYLIIVSPFIKLDEHTKSVLDKIKSNHEIFVFIVFGKNEDYKHKSFNEDDFTYFSEFKNIAILYNKDLHAKFYCNEREGLITSLNLYGFSMVNNIEYGVFFERNILNPLEKLFDETDEFTLNLVFSNSDVVFLKRPQSSSKFFGLKKVYQQSTVLYDVSEAFFSVNCEYDKRSLDSFDLTLQQNLNKVFDQKPQRQIPKKEENDFDSKVQETNIEHDKVSSEGKSNAKGYCIRTGETIPFNPERPFSYKAFRSWVIFQNYDYPENYCHKTGKKSDGKTCMRKPILKSSYTNEEYTNIEM